jgi:carboxymethylenebutenolidase
MSSRVESVETPDGTFDLPVWLPATGRGPGLLLIQEKRELPRFRPVQPDEAAAG